MLPDGHYSFNQLKDVVNTDFNSEKELCEYLEKHIIDFCSDFLDVQYESHIREFKLIKTSRSKLKGNRRIDFWIKTKAQEIIIIECKHPKLLCELSNAVGQCLSYRSLLGNLNLTPDRVILISTKIDIITTQVIKDYNLPLEFMVMDKSKCIKYVSG